MAGEDIWLFCRLRKKPERIDPKRVGTQKRKKAPGKAGGTVSQRDVTWRSGHQMPQAG